MRIQGSIYVKMEREYAHSIEKDIRERSSSFMESSRESFYIVDIKCGKLKGEVEQRFKEYAQHPYMKFKNRPELGKYILGELKKWEDELLQKIQDGGSQQTENGRQTVKKFVDVASHYLGPKGYNQALILYKDAKKEAEKESTLYTDLELIELDLFICSTLFVDGEI